MYFLVSLIASVGADFFRYKPTMSITGRSSDSGFYLDFRLPAPGSGCLPIGKHGNKSSITAAQPCRNFTCFPILSASYLEHL